jgi:HK97 family phage portal protein
MSLFKTEKRAVTVENIIAAAIGGRASGVLGIVDREYALRHSAFWGCIQLISRTVSGLPLDAFRNGVEVDLPPLLTSPSAYVSPIAWREQLMTSLLIRGNFYGMVVETDRLGYPLQIEPLDPDKVTTRINPDGVVYLIDGIAHDRYPNGDIVHLPAYTLPGQPVGLSPMRYGAIALQQGLAAEAFGTQFFRDGAIPTGVLTSGNEVNQEQARVIKDRFMAAMRNTREPLVLGAGTEYKQITVDPTDSQFLETQRWSAEQVCRFFGVDPTMIGVAASGQSVTYANREQKMQDFLSLTISPWLARVEEWLNQFTPNGTTIKFRPAGLLRADTKSRYEVYQIALTNGFMTVDEVRALEDLPPIGTPLNGESPDA